MGYSWSYSYNSLPTAVLIYANCDPITSVLLNEPEIRDVRWPVRRRGKELKVMIAGSVNIRSTRRFYSLLPFLVIPS